MTKVCAKCNTEKSLEEFSTKSKRGGKIQKQPYCKPCNIAYHKEHYKKNRKTYLRKNRHYVSANKERMLQFFKTQKCKDCGTNDHRVLEFDHLRDKKYNISTRIKDLCWETIYKEIEKCDIVCCNCHRIRTLTRCNSYRIKAP